MLKLLSDERSKFVAKNNLMSCLGKYRVQFQDQHQNFLPLSVGVIVLGGKLLCLGCRRMNYQNLLPRIT